MNTNKISIKLRLTSMILDQFTMGILMIPLMSVVSILTRSDEPFEINYTESLAINFVILIFLNKDFAKGKSIAKRLLGLRIIDCRTGKPANELKCFVRNITLTIWPIEVLISLISPTRRLGDFITNTKLELADKENLISIIYDLKEMKLSQTTFWTLIISLIYVILITFLTKSIL